MERQIEAGRRAVLIIIITALAFTVILNLFSFLVSGPGAPRIGQQIFRMSMGVVLFYFLYRGANWARLLAGFLFGVSCPIGVAIGLWYVFHSHWIISICGAVLFAMGVVYGVFFILLFFSPRVKAYFGAR